MVSCCWGRKMSWHTMWHLPFENLKWHGIKLILFTGPCILLQLHAKHINNKTKFKKREENRSGAPGVSNKCETPPKNKTKKHRKWGKFMFLCKWTVFFLLHIFLLFNRFVYLYFHVTESNDVLVYTKIHLLFISCFCILNNNITQTVEPPELWEISIFKIAHGYNLYSNVMPNRALTGSCRLRNATNGLWEGVQ